MMKIGKIFYKKQKENKPYKNRYWL